MLRQSRFGYSGPDQQSSILANLRVVQRLRRLAYLRSFAVSFAIGCGQTWKSHLALPEYELAAVPTAYFGKEYIDAQPKEAKELGCNPDFNAYTGEENPKPDEGLPFRTGAGHIHVGWTEDTDDPVHDSMCHMLVKELDAVLGLPSLLLDPDSERREMYGKAGAHRVKTYGVEYRVLSNFWLSHPAIAALVLDLGQATVQLTLNSLEAMWNVPGMEAARVINTVDVDGARKHIERNFKALRVMLGEHYGDYVAANNAIKTILGGIGSAVERPLEVEHNWRIGTKEPWERDYSWLTASKKLSLRQQI